MSDYMFMLESHLNSVQSQVFTQIRDAAAAANLNLFLTGGAMRDMLAGFPIRDLDFTIEGNPLKLVKTLAQKSGATVLSLDESRKTAELLFPEGATVEIGMAREERFTKPGGKVSVQPATIYEDLRRRDFTVNAIALSLNKASRGLLLDPTNGLADIDRKELHTTSNYALYDDPLRIFRLIRFKARLGFQISERTQSQYQNAREAEIEKKIAQADLGRELRQIALEQQSAEILKALEEEKLLALISPALAGAKLNLPGFQKLQKARQLLPFGVDLHTNQFVIFLHVLFEKLTPKERTTLTKNVGLTRSELDALAKLEPKAKKLEKELAGAKLQKPSVLYAVLSKVPGELILFLLVRSNQRLVHDRLKNYLQKYLPMAQEVTENDVLEKGVARNSPKFSKVREELIASRLDARPKKVVPVEPPPPPPAGRKQMSSGFGR